jgi:hypothetical protein
MRKKDTVVRNRNFFLKIFRKKAVCFHSLSERDNAYDILDAMGAIQIKKYGSPCYEVNWEVFKIGKQTIAICSTDSLDAHIEGPAKLIDQIFNKLENIQQNRIR